MNINLVKTINNYKDYSWLYKGLNKLVLYKNNFTTFPSLLKVTIAKFNLNILLVDKAISIIKKYKIKKMKKNLTPKNRIFNNNSKYFENILEITC
ncbi:hypothetical protein C8035_v005012 [Colletotrichum spinosum]|uniref:Uncharacterized protein n=1 Tax=Colletotrichum spinosum TaxID=1347390 RepID=A0A4R8PU22_9PEZI|nr:hypothetical protein C8035_v005012 [Colletotrichum spinosum]